MWLQRRWVWIGNWIYWTLTIRNYSSIWRYRHFTQSQFTIARTESSRSAVPGTCFQRRMFPFLGFRTVPVPQPQQLHSALKWSSIVLTPLDTLKSSSFWGSSRPASTCHWLRPTINCYLWCNVIPSFQSQSQSYLTTDGQSAGSSRCRSPVEAQDQILIFFVWQLLSFFFV
jgi:hypothetical protein